MGDAGHGEIMSEARDARVLPSEAEEVAEAYVRHARGDLRLALLDAVRDGIAVSALVSRGYARWGRPDSRAQRGPRIP
jgi:hypothetical protein